MRKYIFKYLALFFCGFISSALYPSSGIWDIAGDGIWQDNANWSGATYPQNLNETATLNAPQATNADISINGPISIQGITTNTTTEVSVFPATLNGIVTFNAGTNITITGTNNTLELLTNLEFPAGDHIFSIASSCFVSTIAGATTSGAGNFELSGGGKFILRQKGGNLAIPTFVSGSIKITNGEMEFHGNPSSQDIQISAGQKLTLTNTAASTYAGVISGAGELAIGGLAFGADVYTLTGVNTNTGGTTIGIGIINLQGNGSFPSNGALIINGGSLRISNINPATYSIGNLSGTAGGIILGGKALQVTQTSNQTYNGVISGTGSLTKLGAQKLSLSGANTYSGLTTITAGTLEVTNGGALNNAGNITVATGATLMGNGSVGNVTNNGKVAPGASIGTLTVASYTAGAGGNLEIEIDSTGATDLLNVTGTATLTGGAVTVLPALGVYAENLEFTFLTAGNIVGTFSTLIENSGLDFAIRYDGDNAILRIVTAGAVLPVAIPDLTNNNARQVAEYVFCLSGLDPNLLNLQTNLISLSAADFPVGLVELSPAIFGSIGLQNLQNNIHVANVMSEKIRNLICQCIEVEPADPEITKPKPSNPGIIVWIDPMGFFYNQRGAQDQIGFNLYTYGTTGGVSIPCLDKCLLTVASGYTHSSLFWKKDAGNVETNSVYFGPSFAISNGIVYLNLLAQGSIDFYNAERHVQFSTIDTNANNRHKSYNTLARIDGGAKFLTGNNFYIQPEGSCNYLNFFEEKYSEQGASNFVNLEVDRKLTVFLQPNAGLRLTKEFKNKKYCYAPNVYVGWLANIPLSNGKYTSSLYQLSIPCSSDFTVLGYHRTTNQLSVSAEFLMRKCDSFVFNVGYKADVLSHFQIHAAYLRFALDF